ncbi:C40 family peptidase [Nocardioides sp. TRM66260-LWL]|uniref:C40 family peptidase n=1 Tax=Nocardioides sp. TRM66260-LWL TaxID=2874478 RepID=UPI001CC4B785|nr:C40 family peptidase [Nocardioides sp. TRM66260-LWL]MBZ5734838.1 C40 family peptidase [Nocardioides sp. TRM66260-LWL]
MTIRIAAGAFLQRAETRMTGTTGARRRTSALLAGLSIAALACGGTTAVAADHHRTPTRHEVRHAEWAARHQARDVAAVEADLDAAEARLHRAADAAGAAAEAYNGARYRLQLVQARAARTAADARAARRALSAMRNGVVRSVTSAYEQSPTLEAMAAVTDARGIDGVLDSMATMANAQEALGQRYGDFQAARASADRAAARAEQARAEQADATAAAAAAREQAARAAEAAQAEATSVARRRTALVAELARLQGISTRLAERRQAGLEEARRRAAEERARREALRQAQIRAQQEAQQQAQQEAQQQAQQQQEQQQDAGGSGSSGSGSSGQPSPQVPPSTGDVSAVLGFARAQIGEPYVWGSAGPGSWDCSGLTMMAWRQGGRSLPHYSVAQYEQSTPISLSELRPGDLVFWSSTSSPSGIHHVALYAGNGMIIQAPRTGRDVDEESMYAWEPPTFFARP